MRSGLGFSSLVAMGALVATTWNAGCANGGSVFDVRETADAGSSANNGDVDGGCLTCGSGYTVGQGCPPGLECHVQCENGGTTTISGKVYDPAGRNALYGVAVYVPQKPLEPLPRGVPTGADACSCSALYKSGAVVSDTTKADGSFTLKDAPVGPKVPLVLQIGKWRRQVTIDVKACRTNPQADQSLTLPGFIREGNTTDNMPDIAVSTGYADSLECLLTRIGLPPSEYVAGASVGTGGHIHVFSGGTEQPSAGGMIGAPESQPMEGAPASDTHLWDSLEHMMPYDMTLLSCEGGETYDAKPAVLEQYLDAGGRAFASHYHYAWFTQPAESKQSYVPPADWGDALATWTVGTSPLLQANGLIVQSLNGSSDKFAKGAVMFEWLARNGALGLFGAPPTELPMIPPRYNAKVGPANKASQPWIQDDANGYTMYFSFDTPVNAAPKADGTPGYCGRAVFSDLHVGGETMPPDIGPPPAGCTHADLSPQEKALEFMLFDLSSCVIPDAVEPPEGGLPTQ
ncbi:MAG TPA: hypothetical protein VF765_20210 [Polyangiaceae bacterium]